MHWDICTNLHPSSILAQKFLFSPPLCTEGQSLEKSKAGFQNRDPPPLASDTASTLCLSVYLFDCFPKVIYWDPLLIPSISDV